MRCIVEGAYGGRFVNRPYGFCLIFIDHRRRCPPLFKGNKKGGRVGSAYCAFSKGKCICWIITHRFKVLNFKSMLYLCRHYVTIIHGTMSTSSRDTDCRQCTYDITNIFPHRICLHGSMPSSTRVGTIEKLCTKATHA